MPNSKLPIGDVAKRAGLRTSTLRYYEEAGLLAPPQRLNGRRRYDPEVLGRLRAIRVAQDAGFTLAEIRTLLGGFEPDTPLSARWRELATRKLEEIDAMIERAQGMRRLLEEGLRCDCLTPEECSLLMAAGEQGGNGDVP